MMRQGHTLTDLAFRPVHVAPGAASTIAVPAGTEITLANPGGQAGRWHANLTDGSADLGNLHEGEDFTLGPVLACSNEPTTRLHQTA